MSKFRGQVQGNDACRIYGTLEIHKCHGDFHITARGHGYNAFGMSHLDHDSKALDYLLIRNEFYTHH
jgi:hypothetical protein